MAPIVVVHENTITGVVAPVSGVWVSALQTPRSTMEEIQAKYYVLARETDLVAKVLERMALVRTV